jgi:hypothetical protein
VIAREQQSDVDRNASEGRFLDGRKAFDRAGDLDEEIGPIGLRMQRLGSGDTSSDTKPSTPAVR